MHKCLPFSTFADSGPLKVAGGMLSLLFSTMLRGDNAGYVFGGDILSMIVPSVCSRKSEKSDRRVMKEHEALVWILEFQPYGFPDL